MIGLPISDCSNPQRMWLLQVSRKRSDITYWLKDFSVKQIDSLPGENAAINVDAQEYLTVLETLDGGQGTIPGLIYMALDNSMVDDGFISRVNPLENNLLLLPLTQQLYYSERPFVNGTVRKETYRVSLAQDAIQIFTAGSTAVLVWCLIALGISSYNRMPEVSAFPDLDLVTQVLDGKDENALCDVSARLMKTKPRDLARAISEVRVYVQERARQVQGAEGTGYELE